MDGYPQSILDALFTPHGQREEIDLVGQTFMSCSTSNLKRVFVMYASTPRQAYIAELGARVMNGLVLPLYNRAVFSDINPIGSYFVLQTWCMLLGRPTRPPRNLAHYPQAFEPYFVGKGSGKMM